MVSALVGHGKPRRLVFELLRRHEVITFAQMLAELSDVLSRTKFTLTAGQVEAFLSVLARNATVIKLARTFNAIPEDPDDDVVLGTTLVGRASHIVTGDAHLLKLARYRGIRVVTVGETLQLILHRR